MFGTRWISRRKNAGCCSNLMPLSWPLHRLVSRPILTQFIEYWMSIDGKNCDWQYRRLFHQVPGPNQCQQCFRVRHVSNKIPLKLSQESTLSDLFRRQEDLGLYGNQLNYMTATWTVGYVIGQIPSNIALTKLPPRYWIPAAEVRCGQPSTLSTC